MGVVANDCRVAKVEYFCHPVVRGRADEVLVGEPGCVVDLSCVVEASHRVRRIANVQDHDVRGPVQH